MNRRIQYLAITLWSLTCWLELGSQILFKDELAFPVGNDLTIIQDPDTEVQFVDYSNFTIGSETFSIPEAPNKIDGSINTRGLVIRANITAGTKAGVNVLAGQTPLTFTGDYVITFDAYMSYAEGSSGPTESIVWGAGVKNDAILEGRNNRSSGALGTYGWLSNDNGFGTEDAAIFEDNVELKDKDDGQGTETQCFDNAFVDMGSSPTVGERPFGQWVEVRIAVIAGLVSVYYNDVLFFAELSSPTGPAMMGYEDPFGSSINSEPDFTWALFDNFVVTAGCASNTRTWLGATSADWHNASNWSPSCVPSISDNVIIPMGTIPGPTVSAPLLAKAKTMDAHSFTAVCVEPGAQLVVDP